MDVGGLFGPLLAFVAGLLSFVSPCVLPLAPVYLAQMTGVGATSSETTDRRRLILHSLSFVAGLTIVFVALGASVGLIGYALLDRVPLLIRFAGVLVIVFGLHLTGIIRIPYLYRSAPLRLPGCSRASYAGSGLIGAAFGLGWTPCIGPVLSSILAMAASSGSVAHGAFLLLLYAAGLGVPFLAISLALDSATRALKRLNSHLLLLERVSGVVLIIMGVLLFTNTLTRISQLGARFGIGGL